MNRAARELAALRQAGDRRTAADRRVERRGAAHDARLALATARALLATQLEQEPALPPDTVACLRDAAREVDRVTVLLGPDLGLPTAAACDLAAVAHDVARVEQAASGTRVVCHGHGVLAAADAMTVWRVLTNLVDNGCRAAGPGGTVAITVTPADDGRSAVATVHDTGSGRARPWTPGIGLGVVTRLVARLGGRLDVLHGPNGGTGVQVTLATVVPSSPAPECVTV